VAASAQRPGRWLFGFHRRRGGGQRERGRWGRTWARGTAVAVRAARVGGGEGCPGQKYSQLLLRIGNEEGVQISWRWPAS
jgi:hypothetical protein